MATVALSVFGLGSQVDITSETLALAGVVGFIVAFEMAAHRLEHRLAGTPYMGMLAKIYKELMIMGFISLGVFLMLQFGSVGSTTAFYTFEFAHIVVFFTTLIFVMQACLMMVLSSRLKKRYEKSTNISVDHLLTFYSLHRKSKLFHARWLPFSDLREVMEFKIVHFFFRTTFALPTTFNFSLYMREATDNHILALVDVESSTWVILAAVCFLNLARIKIWQAISRTQDGEYSADDDHATDDHATADDDGHHRRLAGGGSDTSDTYDNTGSDGEMTFIVSGWLMLALAIANYIMSRWVELRLLKKAGCEGTREYAERLAVIEKQTLGAKREENARRSGVHNGHLKRLKRQVEKAREGGNRPHNARRHHPRKKQGRDEEEGSFHGPISRHLDRAKRHAHALSSRVGSGDLKREIMSSGGRSSSSQSFFWLGNKGRKVLPGGHGAQDLSPFHGPGALKNALDSAQQSHQGGSESTKRASGDSSTITTTTTTQASVTLPPLAQIPGGVGTGTGTGGGSLREDTAASALEGVTPFRASEHEKPGRESIRHPPGVSHGGRDHPPLELLEQRGPHGGEQQKYEEGEQDNETQRGGGAEGVVVDEPLWKKVYVTSVPGLTTQVDGCDGGDSLEPLELLVKQQRPMPLVEEMAVSRCGQEGGGQDGDRDRGGGGGDGGDNDDDDNDDDGDGDDYEDDDDDDENSFHPISRRPSRSVSAVGRRASIVAREQARRLSQRVSQSAVWQHTSKLVVDVTTAAERLRKKPSSGVPTLNLFNDLSDIYPLGSPMLFHKSLDVLLLLSCTYLALWGVNFMIVANEKQNAGLHHLAMLLPAAGVFLFNALSVKTSSLLLAISAMDPEIIGKVIDQQIDEGKLVVQFRERLTSRLGELGLGQSGLASAFEEVDVAGRGELTYKELSHVLFTLNFHASKEKYRKLFNVMDKSQKGVVSYHQLCELVYHQEAAAQEEMALKMKGKMHAIK